MLDANALQDMWSWEGRRRALRALYRSPHFTDRGLEIGAETLLARKVADEDGRSHLDLERDFTRAQALLAVAYERPVELDDMLRVHAASQAYRKPCLHHSGLCRIWLI